MGACHCLGEIQTVNGGGTDAAAPRLAMTFVGMDEGEVGELDDLIMARFTQDGDWLLSALDH